jgi:membrane protease YdiL (CAAX protease family)
LDEATRQNHSTVVATVILVVIAMFLGGNFFRRDIYALSPPLYWIFDFLKFVVVPTGAAVVLARRYAILPKHYGLRWEASREDWGHFLGLTIFLALILNLVYYTTQQAALLVFRPEPITGFYNDINPRGLLRVPVTLYLAVTAGIVEEVVFRGLPLLYLEHRYPNAVPRRTYLFGTALCFGLIHWPNGPHEFVATFVFGLLAAAIYLRLRDLWPLVAAHILIDVYNFA